MLPISRESADDGDLSLILPHDLVRGRATYLAILEGRHAIALVASSG